MTTNKKYPSVFITRQIPEAAINLLKKKKINVKVYKEDHPIPEKELIKNIQNVDAVISLLTDKFDSSVIDEMRNCKIIANYAVGFNNIDIEYAKKKSIIVSNTPDVLTDTTADLTVSLVLACARRIVEGEKFLMAKKYKGWKPKLLLGVELKDKTFGILGAGRIGTAVAIRAKAFGTNIVYFSNKKNEFLEQKTGAKKLSLKSLLKKSDFISVNLPLTEKTYHLLNKENLSLLKRSAILVNTARGEIIDEKELIRILKQKKIRCAGLDVFENEPNLNPEFFKLNNVVLLPHIGSATEEARTKMALLAARNVIAVLSGQKPVTPVS
jgi:glyoxylate reductase